MDSDSAVREVWHLPEAMKKSFVHTFYSKNEATNDSGSEKSYFAQTLKLACFRRRDFLLWVAGC